jgi:hypothetical protein
MTDLSWIMAAALSPSQKLVLIALTWRANGERVCFPSLTRLAKDTGLARSVVAEAVRYLRDVLHLIEAVTDKAERLAVFAKQGAKAGTLSTVYRVLVPNTNHTSPAAGPVRPKTSPPTGLVTHRKKTHTSPAAGLSNDNTSPAAGPVARQTSPPPGPIPVRQPDAYQSGSRTRTKKGNLETELRGAQAREGSVGFNSHGVKEGSKEVPDHDPTPAEVEEQRKASAEAIAGLSPELAAVIQGLGRSVRGVAYAPGRSSSLDRWEQERLLRPKVKAFYLTREQLAAVGHRPMVPA